MSPLPGVHSHSPTTTLGPRVNAFGKPSANYSGSLVPWLRGGRCPGLFGGAGILPAAAREIVAPRSDAYAYATRYRIRVLIRVARFLTHIVAENGSPFRNQDRCDRRLSGS